MERNKCPNCGSNLFFNPKSGMIECTHCETKKPIDIPAASNIKREYTPDYKPTLVQKKVVGFKCSTCGAQHMLTDNNTLTRCPSCGNTTIEQSSEVVYQPDGIVPFKVSRQKAGEIFKKWMKTRKFAPTDLIEMAKYEKISGFYTPVWNLNYQSCCRYNAVVTNVSVDKDYNEVRQINNIHNTLKSLHIDDMYSANKNVQDEFLKEIGPFDLNEMSSYSPQYMFGFSGTEANRSIHEVYNSILEAETRKNKNQIESQLELKYSILNSLECRTDLRQVCFNYLYVPIWANHYKYKNKLYHCFINGSTGEVTGKSPKSFWKIFSLVAGILGGIALLAILII